MKYLKDDVSHLKEIKTEQRSEFDLKLETMFKQMSCKEYIPPLKLPAMLNDLSEKIKIYQVKKFMGICRRK